MVEFLECVVKFSSRLESFGHYFFEYFSCPFSSSFGITILHVLGHLTLLEDMFMFLIFFYYLDDVMSINLSLGLLILSSVSSNLILRFSS